jgi:hypothetical protein
MDRIDWQPGNEGKGIVDEDGHVHAWHDEDYPLHRDYLKAHPSTGSPLAYFYVEPDGMISITHPSPNPAYGDPQQHEAMMDLITQADHHFYPEEPNDWKFA